MKAIYIQEFAPFANSSNALPEKSLSANAMVDQPDPVLQKVRNWIESNLTEDIRIDDLPRVLYYSRAQVFRKIKSLTGQSPSRFICSIRLEKAMELLQSSNLKTSDIAAAVGFTDVKYFFRVFRREYGAPPSAIRQKTYK